MRFTIRLACLALPLIALGTATRAVAADCTEITAVPAVIQKSGVYCLRKSFSYAASSGIAIRIQADNVVLDLNEQFLDGSASGAATTAFGVYADNQKNVTVRNGAITGFSVGVALSQTDPSAGTLGHVVERLQVLRATSIGISVEGKGSIVRHNLLVGTGGSSSLPPGWATVGISVGGAGSQVADNRIVDTFELPGGQAIGISVAETTGTVVERNVISNIGFGPARSEGIRVYGTNVTAAENRISNMRNGIVFLLFGTGLYIGNTVGGATTPFSGGTAAGNTNYSF